MKANRITMIVCAAIVLLSGISIAFISNDLAKNIAVSIFTGFIVSLVIATIGYFHERAVLLEKIDFGMKSLYINMGSPQGNHRKSTAADEASTRRRRSANKENIRLG